MIKSAGMRALSLLLAILFFIPWISVYAEDTETACEQLSADERALKKIYELAELLDGRYFTTDNKPCSDNSCNKCYNENVIQCGWFSDLFGYTLKCSQLPYQYFPDGSLRVPRGWSCFGFAAFAQWYIFAEGPDDTIGKDISKVSKDKSKFDYATLSEYARPGDVIRVQRGSDTSSGHSMIFISCSESGATVLDGNFIKDDLVGIHTISFSSKYGSLPYSACPVSITRCNGYESVTAPADPTSEIIFTDMNAPVCHTEGKSFAMRGMISSASVISEVKCRIADAASDETVFEYTESPKLRTFDIGQSGINSNTKFAKFKKGLYILEYTATDTNGYSKTWRSLKFSIIDASHICKYGEHELLSLPKDGCDGEIIYTCALCGCEHKVCFAGHIYTDECDTECDACGEKRTPPHKFDGVGYDAASHCKVCSLCGATAQPEAHTFTQGICSVCGFSISGQDIDGDGNLSSDDAIYLLYHIFFPEDYPTEHFVDFDKNGSVDADDAIYLLYHIFFPNDYPV